MKQSWASVHIFDGLTQGWQFQDCSFDNILTWFISALIRLKRLVGLNPGMCSERDSPLEPFVLSAPSQPELARLICGTHLSPPVLTRKQKRPRVNSLVCDRAAAFWAAGPPEVLSRMSHSGRRVWTRASESSQPAAQTSCPKPARRVSFAWVRR